MEKLEKLISAHALNELERKLEEMVGYDAFYFIYPAVKIALEEGNGNLRSQIIMDWLHLDSCRVCSECGAIMEKGWHNMGSYACSDECVIKQEGITREEFDRFQIYKQTIQSILDDEGEGRKADDLTKEEIDEILDDIIGDLDAYYTEWS